jgi:ATP-dependent RNA helicase DDX27
VVSRQVPQEESDKWTKKLRDFADEIEEVLQEEKEERAMSITERDLKRGENLIVHEDEIKARPRRTWFESEKDKEAAKERGAALLNGPAKTDNNTKKKKLSGKNDVRSEGKVWKKGKEDRGKKTLSAVKGAPIKGSKAGKPKGGKPMGGKPKGGKKR